MNFVFLLIALALYPALASTSAFAHETAGSPPPTDTYFPPIRTARVSGTIQYAFQEVCKFEVSAPVYDQRTVRGLSIPAYADCVTTIEGQPALIRTALSVQLSNNVTTGVAAKWLEVSMFAMEKKGSDLGETIGYIYGSAATENLEEKSLRFFTVSRGKIGKQNQYRLILNMIETQL